MRILLDECVPRKLRQELPGHDVRTVPGMGWAGKRNGELLALMAANPAAGFVQFIRAVTDPFYGMFRGIVQSPTVEGGNTLALPVLIAIVAYMLLHLAIKGLFRVVAQRRTEI